VTAIRLIVRPDDDPRVKAADHLEVYVGYGAATVPRAVEVHADDEQTEQLHIDVFDAAIPVYLTDEGALGPFWVGVRAVSQGTAAVGTVVGEGGLDSEIQFEPGMLVQYDVFVRAAYDENGTRFPDVWSRCPGWTDGHGTRHHIIAALDTVDCDEDGVPYEQGGQDCNDFDPSFFPGAMDAVCDGVDHSCGLAPATGQIDCIGPVIGDPTQCALGVKTCRDDMPTGGDCTVGSRLPQAACACVGLALDQLDTCLAEHATSVVCEVTYDAGGFCLGTNTLPLDQPAWWFDASGADASEYVTRWLARGTPSVIQPGWEVAGTFSSGETTEWPPSPAVRAPGGLATLPDQGSDLFLALAAHLTTPELFEVEFRMRRETTCDPKNVAVTCDGLGN
jgi:hypothetical protein